MLRKIISLQIASLIMVFCLVSAVFLIYKENVLLEQTLKSSLQETSSGSLVVKDRVYYIIDDGTNTLSYRVAFSKSSTVFSLLEELAEKQNFEIESVIYPEMGVLVESIAGLKNGKDNNYWQYWVNEELPMLAADKKSITKGDKIEWKFLPVSF